MSTKNKFPLKVQGRTIIKDKIPRELYLSELLSQNRKDKLKLILSKEQVEAILNYKTI
ncbi:TPA: hypothetical protein ACG0AP_001213 [Elizabethkingia anophelis]